VEKGVGRRDTTPNKMQTYNTLIMLSNEYSNVNGEKKNQELGQFAVF